MKAQENFGKKLRLYRTQQGMSQEDLALKADIDRTYIASVENGKRNVSIQTIHKFLKAINIPFNEFFSDFNEL